MSKTVRSPRSGRDRVCCSPRSCDRSTPTSSCRARCAGRARRPIPRSALRDPRRSARVRLRARAPSAEALIDAREDLALWKAADGFAGGETLAGFQARVAQVLELHAPPARRPACARLHALGCARCRVALGIRPRARRGLAHGSRGAQRVDHRARGLARRAPPTRCAPPHGDPASR